MSVSDAASAATCPPDGTAWRSQLSDDATAHGVFEIIESFTEEPTPDAHTGGLGGEGPGESLLVPFTQRSNKWTNEAVREPT